jgi:hypothetical protein
MSKALREQIDQLFEATKDLKSLEEIKPHCDRFNEWINTHTNYSTKSLGTVLSRYGFYKTHIPHPQLSHRLHWLVVVNNSRND